MPGRSGRPRRIVVIFHGLNVDVFENRCRTTRGIRTTRSSFRRSRHPTSRSCGTRHAARFTSSSRSLYVGFLLALLELLRGRVREVLRLAVRARDRGRRRRCRSEQPPRSPTFPWRSCSRWPVSSPGAGSSTPTGSRFVLFALFAAGAYATKFEGRIFVGALCVTMIVLIAVTDRVRLQGHDRRGRRRARRARAVVALGREPPGRRCLLDLAPQDGSAATSLTRPAGSRRRSPRSGRASSSHAMAAPRVRHRRCPRHRLSRRSRAARGVAFRRNRRAQPRGLILVYMATPLELHAHLSHSARRVVSGPVLFAVVLVPLLLEAVLRAPSREERDRQYPLPP